MQFRSIVATFLILAAWSCKQSPGQYENPFLDLKRDTSIKYAKRFAIASNNYITAVYVFGNRLNYDTTAVFFICKDSLQLKKSSKNVVTLLSPCKKIAVLSSIYASMLNDLNSLDKLAAIDNSDYICNHAILQKFKADHLLELSKGAQIDLEQTIALNPDVIFTFGMGDPDRDVDAKLKQTKIPVAVSVDHLESSPLARAEWIKFFAAFVDKKQKADSVFSEVEKHYLSLKTLAKKVGTKPTVFSEIKYGDVWYLPGGKSYVAQLMKDAGADYVWRTDTNSGSLSLNFEQVYIKAKEADYWINLSLVKTKAELLTYESRYSEFNAFKKDHLFNNTKVTNAKGYSTYWETGMIYPDRILSDLIHIFHPEVAASLKNDLYYYKQIK